MMILLDSGQQSDFSKNNLTTIFILGFQNIHDSRIVLFFLLLLTFCVTIFGNTLIICLVCYSRNLHSPMYFFIMQLSVCDILLSVDSVPNTLNVVLHEGGTISFGGCIIQFIFFFMSECTECLLLTVMSYDRYLAICNPLQYSSIMGDELCHKLAIMSWSLSAVYSFVLSVSISSLHFCGLNILNHFFCDLAPLLELSCSDVTLIQIEAKVITIPAAVCPFLIIVVSYIYIARSILKISSVAGRKKAFFTCSSHLIVVFIYYGTVLAAYIFPPSMQSQAMNRIFTMVYAVVTPCLNPIVYSLRNKDIWEAMAQVNTKLGYYK